MSKEHSENISASTENDLTTGQKEPPAPIPSAEGKNERMESVNSAAFFEGDEYDDYDDFELGNSGAGGGGGGKSNKMNRRQDNRGGSGGSGSVYSAKHVRAKEALQSKGK